MDAFQSAVRAISSQYHNIQQNTQYNVIGAERPAAAPSANEEFSYEKWEKTPRPRGRQAKDPRAEYIRFDCKDVDDLENYLSEYLQAPTAPAEHATIEFHFPVTSAFMVYTRDFKRDSSTVWTSANVTDLMKRTAVSVMEVLQPTENAKDQVVRQKAVARTIVEAIQRVDGFRYSFHNNWMSREDRAHRFSFFCNDSTLNKGRAANGGVGTEGRAKKKPVYDCKGLIAIKFSITKNNLEVHYRHVPVHKTYEERAPPPRKESKRQRMLEVLDPEAAKQLANAKKPRKEIVIKEKSPPRKRGRPPKSTGVSGSSLAGPQPGSTDESLQSLLAFLGSAERQTPLNRQMSYRNLDDDDDGADGGITIADDGIDEEPARNDETPSDSLVAFPAEKRKEVQPNPLPKARRKNPGPTLPGTMDGSPDSGNLTWSDLRNETPDTARAKQTEKAKKVRKRTVFAESSKETTAPLSGVVDAAKSPLSELELLKKQLAATQERLQKLEADKQAPPWPYPPYGYPYYPYPPPPPSYYPPPPVSSTQWPSKTTANFPPRSHEFQHYQPSTHTPQSTAPPLYPGGPPHPNARPMIAPPASQTQSFAQSGAISGAKPAVSDAPATVRETPSAAATESAELRIESVPRPRSTSGPVVPAGNEIALAPHARSSQPTNTAPAPPVQSMPARQVSSQVLSRAEPLTGVLKLVDNGSAQQAAHNVSFQVSQNAKGAGPQKGKLRLINTPPGPNSNQPGASMEDVRMKGLFDSALAAIAGPQPAAGASFVMYSPGTKGTSKNASNPAPASVLDPQYQPPAPNWPHPYGHPPYPYQHSVMYPYPYPYPPHQQQYPPPQTGPFQPAYSFQPPAPPAPVPTPGEQPPPGYDSLRAQMLAHTQAVPGPPPKVGLPTNTMVSETATTTGATISTNSGKGAGIQNNGRHNTETDADISPNVPVELNAERGSRHANSGGNSSQGQSVTAPEVIATRGRTESPQSTTDDSD